MHGSECRTCSMRDGNRTREALICSDYDVPLPRELCLVRKHLQRATVNIYTHSLTCDACRIAHLVLAPTTLSKVLASNATVVAQACVGSNDADKVRMRV